MGNRCKFVINVVTHEEPKTLIGFNQKVCGKEQRLRNPLSWTNRPPAESEVLTHLVVKTEHGKPIVLPFAGRKPQGVPMGLWVKEEGESECRTVMVRIGAAAQANIAPRESGQTSLWSFVTRAFGKPTKETKQMTAGIPAGAVSAPLVAHRFQARIVKFTPQGVSAS